MLTLAEKVYDANLQETKDKLNAAYYALTELKAFAPKNKDLELITGIADLICAARDKLQDC
jgi:hypothetical protein